MHLNECVFIYRTYHIMFTILFSEIERHLVKAPLAAAISPKMNKNWVWEVKKSLTFLSTGHRILPSCDCKVREIMVAKFEVVFQRTSPVD